MMAYSRRFNLMARLARWEFTLAPGDPPFDATARHLRSVSVNPDVGRNVRMIMVIIRDMHS